VGPNNSGSVVFDQLVGVNLSRLSDFPVTLSAGRFPSPGSVTQVDVTPVLLARYGITGTRTRSVVGSQIILGAPRGFRSADGTPVFRSRWTKATIVGVVTQQAGSGGVLASLSLVRADQRWTAAAGSPYAGLFVIARGLDAVPSVRAAIEAVGYSTSAPENLIATVERYVHVVEIVLTGIGVIALAIASLGITNALLAAVRERRREIGILKAVGARDRDVLRSFLIEAGVMGALGGVIGTVLGLALARLVAAIVDGYLTSQGLAGVHVSTPYQLAVATVVGATVLAVAAGALPAWRAARLPAREAVEL
jgi:hypothetical protein